jgi:hypothetical protein
MQRCFAHTVGSLAVVWASWPARGSGVPKHLHRRWLLKLRCFGFYRTRTRIRCRTFEYEKPGKTSIETLKHANSETSSPLAAG